MKLNISKILIIQLLILFNLVSNSQTFDFIKKITPPPAPQNSSVFYELNASEQKAYITDIDNDLDIIISGYKILVYENNGMGDFQLKSELDYGYQYVCDFEMIDIENDNDKDFVIFGSSYGSYYKTFIFINDGSGNYTVDVDNNLIENHNGNVAVADVDNDGDEDFFIIGEGYLTELYINDGFGHFSNSTQDFPNNSQGSMAEFADFDNDDDMDLIISGADFCNVYENNSLGTFTKTETPIFLKYYNGYISIGDIDNDNDIDLLINGRAFQKTLTNIYENITPNGIIEIDKASEITYYPNPTTGLFYVDLKKYYMEIFVEIKNELGQIVETERIYNVNKIKLRLYQKGLYIVTIKNNGNLNENFKIINY